MASANVPINMPITFPHLKCLQCIGEYQLVTADRERGILHDGREPVIPEICDAVTMAPTWVQNHVMGQVVMAAVVVPSCFKHVQSKKESPVERATRSGLALGGNGMPG